MPYHIIYIIIIDEHRTNNNNKLSLILYFLEMLGGPALSVKLLWGPGPFGPGESAPMPLGQVPVGGASVYRPDTKQGGPSWMCGQHNVRAFAGDSTGQNTDKGHTPNPRIGIKIPDSAGNRTRGRRVGRQRLYRPCYSDELINIPRRQKYTVIRGW